MILPEPLSIDGLILKEELSFDCGEIYFPAGVNPNARFF
jgi:hypothetical protein